MKVKQFWIDVFSYSFNKPLIVLWAKVHVQTIFVPRDIEILTYKATSVGHEVLYCEPSWVGSFLKEA